MATPFNILVAEKAPYSELITELLAENFPGGITTVTSSPELPDVLSTKPFQLAIIATDLTPTDPFGDLRLIRSHYPAISLLPVILNDNPEHVAEAVNLNLVNYISKPYCKEEIVVIVKKCLAIAAAKKNTPPPQPSPTEKSFHGIIGNCEPMQKLFTLISRIADDDFSTVLIRGESGTGKELVAKAIHAHSKRKNKHFVPVNCAAIPDDLLESELFGHTKGAFTGANQNKQGRIQYADGGTLFLDEIGDMKASLQAKLLRVLQEKEFEPVGALKPIPVDTRVLAATHCDLEQLVMEGKFREDLYYRLSVIPLSIPSLRDRCEDITLLLDNFIEKFTTQRGKKTFSFTPRAYACLQNQKWRGNVRELENLVQYMSILHCGGKVDVEDLPEKYQQNMPVMPKQPPLPSELSVQPDERYALQHQFDLEEEVNTNLSWEEGAVDFKGLINDFETSLILQAMKMSKGNKKEAAKLLNLKRTTLLEKIKKKNLNDSLWNS